MTGNGPYINYGIDQTMHLVHYSILSLSPLLQLFQVFVLSSLPQLSP